MDLESGSLPGDNAERQKCERRRILRFRYNSLARGGQKAGHRNVNGEHSMRKILQFRLIGILAFVSLLAVGLESWRNCEESRLATLKLAREQALVEWRKVKGLYDVRGPSLAQDEAEARELYFHRRDAVEEAVVRSWWPGNLRRASRR